MQKILLTGANGYIGRRLKRLLLKDRDISLRLMVRKKHSLSPQIRNEAEVVEGDALDKASLLEALKGVDTAYYLIHSLASGDSYRNLDKEAATNFKEACEEQGVRRIIYLGGLGEKESASEHLVSRLETGEILSSSESVESVWLRAGVIIGSGSASFEIVRNLAQKLPVMITPKWVGTMAQPIGVDDVLSYLHGAKELQMENKHEIVDIGAEAMEYREMIIKTAEVMGLKRYIIPVPVLTPKLSSYWLTLFTPVPYSISHSLIEGLKSPVLVQNSRAKELFDIKPASFEGAVKKAIEDIEQNQVISRWSDSFGERWEDMEGGNIAQAVFTNRQKINIKNLPKEKVYESFTAVGGKNGWFTYDFLWDLRGVIDKFFGGFGTNRGRRDECDLRLGDCLDFWKVVDIEKDKRLLLYAQMKLPGKAWLEFVMEGDEFIQSAYFYPDGIFGRLYWYALVPVHHFVFKDLAQKIVRRAVSI